MPTTKETSDTQPSVLARLHEFLNTNMLKVSFKRYDPGKNPHESFPSVEIIRNFYFARMTKVYRKGKYSFGYNHFFSLYHFKLTNFFSKDMRLYQYG